MPTYHDEHILGRMEARLMPPDNTYPDCICLLLLTEQRLYVLEDQYDGTYEQHFAIPVTDVLSLDRYLQISSKSGEESFDKEPRGWKRPLLHLVGTLNTMAPMGQPDKKVFTYYVRLLYRAEAGTEQTLFFKDANNPYPLARKLERFKTQHALNL